MKKIAILTSILLSLSILFMISIYLMLKALVLPVFTKFDRILAGLAFEYVDGDFLSIIANSKEVYLPEARADLLFDLGLYFPKER